MPKIMTTRDKQALATKNRIYKAGIKLIKKNGFDKVNIAQIAKEANVSVGTVYHYYKSKLDLFMDLYREADNHFQKIVSGKIKELKLNEQILLYFDEYCKLPKKDGVELITRIFVPDNPLFLEKSRAMQYILYSILENGKTSGQLPANTDIQEMTDNLFLIARGVVFDWALRKGEYNLNEKMNHMIGKYIKTY